MLLIAVTGGIASGKSAVSRRLAEHGALVIDADQIARDVVEPGEPALARLAEAFGPGIIRPDGSLDRAALGAIAFADPEKVALLNSITHPAIQERTQRLFAEAAAAHPDGVLVYDVPLLAGVRSDRTSEFRFIVAVEADPETRVRRMVELRGMSEADARARIASQATDEQRREIADWIIDTNGSIEETNAQADALWARLQEHVTGSA